MNLPDFAQSSARPARDVFTRSSQLVSSIVVVPLIAGDGPALGGLYFTFNSPCDFMHIQDTLLVGSESALMLAWT
jgi:hypothetical protein